eukprot:7792698-Pyramimonas_sp.AAC.1
MVVPMVVLLSSRGCRVVVSWFVCRCSVVVPLLSCCFSVVDPWLTRGCSVVVRGYPVAIPWLLRG